jgi:hypothetical protein
MRRALVVAGLVGAVGWIGADLSGGGGQATATTPTRAAAARIIDRTLLCSTLLQAGVRKIGFGGTAAARGQEDVAGRKQLAEVGLTSGSHNPAGLAGIVAGGSVDPARGSDTFYINRRYCSPSRTRVPLSARGLVGGAASPFGEGYECFPPRRILVRARAIFRSPTSLRRRAESFWTPTPVERGYVAARTLSGKPLVFGEIAESGAARLFAAPRCIPE